MAWKLRKDKLKSDEPAAPDPAPPAVVEAASTPADTADASFERLGEPLGFDLSANIPHPDHTGHTTEPEFAEDDLPKFSDEDLPRFADETPTFHSEPEAIAAPVEDEPITVAPPVEDEPVTFTEPAEQEPISLGAFAPYQPPMTPHNAFDLEPIPEFAPVVAAPVPEPEAVEVTPLAFAHDEESAETEPPQTETPEPGALPTEEPIALPVEAEAMPVAEPLAPSEEPEETAEELPAFAEESPAFAEDEIPAVPAFDVSPQREAAAPGLVTTESDTGMPRVAPFILDTPDAVAPAESDRMHHIVLRLGNLSASYILVKDVTTIGRPDSAVQNYPDIEIELDDGVSRRHAEIRRQGDQFFVVDMGSTNGTILNGEMLTPEQPVPLRSGDRIRVGERTEMLFE